MRVLSQHPVKSIMQGHHARPKADEKVVKRICVAFHGVVGPVSAVFEAVPMGVECNVHRASCCGTPSRRSSSTTWRMRPQSPRT